LESLCNTPLLICVSLRFEDATRDENPVFTFQTSALRSKAVRAASKLPWFWCPGTRKKGVMPRRGIEGRTRPEIGHSNRTRGGFQERVLAFDGHGKHPATERTARQSSASLDEQWKNRLLGVLSAERGVSNRGRWSEFIPQQLWSRSAALLVASFFWRGKAIRRQRGRRI